MGDFFLRYWLEFAFGLVALALTGGFQYLYKRIKAQNEGMRALLRAELIRSGEKYVKRGYCEIYAMDAYDKTYKAYHDLGGNGTMTELHERVMELPTHAPDDSSV
jgi:hypothetical protein